ncbi:hypothetical protein [Shewanella sp.]|uniref:hypothetical protein n=1 Tax=Shewanella sp. TaxID=50422 RepID=UPI001EBA9873|nr:hypothetical protein [Shewanella sp.]NRB25814.1 hypothetical protein [Shewanella sp.]
MYRRLSRLQEQEVSITELFTDPVFMENQATSMITGNSHISTGSLALSLLSYRICHYLERCFSDITYLRGPRKIIMPQNAYDSKPVRHTVEVEDLEEDLQEDIQSAQFHESDYIDEQYLYSSDDEFFEDMTDDNEEPSLDFTAPLPNDDMPFQSPQARASYRDFAEFVQERAQSIAQAGVWHPWPKRPYLEPALHLFNQGLPTAHNCMTGQPLFGPKPTPRQPTQGQCPNPLFKHTALAKRSISLPHKALQCPVPSLSQGGESSLVPGSSAGQSASVVSVLAGGMSYFLTRNPIVGLATWICTQFSGAEARPHVPSNMADEIGDRPISRSEFHDLRVEMRQYLSRNYSDYSSRVRHHLHRLLLRSLPELRSYGYKRKLDIPFVIKGKVLQRLLRRYRRVILRHSDDIELLPALIIESHRLQHDLQQWQSEHPQMTLHPLVNERAVQAVVEAYKRSMVMNPIDEQRYLQTLNDGIRDEAELEDQLAVLTAEYEQVQQSKDTELSVYNRRLQNIRSNRLGTEVKKHVADSPETMNSVLNRLISHAKLVYEKKVAQLDEELRVLSEQQFELQVPMAYREGITQAINALDTMEDGVLAGSMDADALFSQYQSEYHQYAHQLLDLTFDVYDEPAVIKWQVAKFHLTQGYNQLEALLTLKDSVLPKVQEYKDASSSLDGFIANQWAKEIAVTCIAEQFNRSKGDGDVIALYEQWRQDETVGFYLSYAALMAYGALTGHYTEQGLPQDSNALPWSESLQYDFQQASTGYIQEPPGFKSILSLKRSETFGGSGKDYTQQFDDYKKNHAQTEAKIHSYQVLTSHGISYQHAKQLQVQKFRSFTLEVSPQTGSGWARATSTSRGYGAGGYAGPWAGKRYQLPGSILVFWLERGETLVVSTIDGYSASILLSEQESRNHRLLNLLKRSGNHASNQLLNGMPLIHHLLKLLWPDDSNNPIVSREHSYIVPAEKDIFGRVRKKAYTTSNGAYPFLVAQKHSHPNSSLLTVLQSDITQSLKDSTEQFWHINRDEHFWEVIGKHFVPFYDTVFNSLYEPGYEIDALDLSVEIVSMALMLVPVVGSIARMSKVMKLSMRSAMRQGLQQGLRGNKLRRFVKNTLMKDAAFLAELRNLGQESLDTLWDMVDPSPVPFGGISPSMISLNRMGKRLNDAAPNQPHDPALHSAMTLNQCLLPGRRVKRGLHEDKGGAGCLPIINLFSRKSAPDKGSSSSKGSLLRKETEGLHLDPVRTIDDAYIREPNQYSTYSQALESNREIKALIDVPNEKCEAMMPLAGKFMKEIGFTNIRYRGMFIWTNGLDNMPGNHFVVLGDIGGNTLVFDLTAAQFENKGMPTLTEALVLSEPGWAKRFQQATTRKLIKYKDFDTSGEARGDFSSMNTPLPTDDIIGSTLLTEPGWYRTMIAHS